MASLSSCQGFFPAEVLQPSQGEISNDVRRASQMRGNCAWHMASWNVRMLVDVDRPIEIARFSSFDVSVIDERKIDQVINELDRYQVSVSALQETKWSGVDAYKIGGSVVLTAGRDVPDAGQRRQRGKGVAIALSGKAIHAWTAGGSQWKAWSLRLVTATLEVGYGRLHILSCYAPTFIASREECVCVVCVCVWCVCVCVCPPVDILKGEGFGYTKLHTTPDIQHTNLDTVHAHHIRDSIGVSVATRR